MTTTKLIIEMDLETGKVRVGHPDSKAHCDYMLAEAKRILDRLDDIKSYEERGFAPGGRIQVPAGLHGGLHGESGGGVGGNGGSNG